MNRFQRICFCDYRWLWILVIIISIIATKAQPNPYKDFFDTNIINKRESINSPKIEKIVTFNSNQRTVSRPSTVLKQLWSSASKSVNNSDEYHSNSSQSFAVRLRDFLFRPTKWSSDIVPSIPLSLQLSTDAIELPPRHQQGTKSETKGDITVINGFSTSISYPPKDYQIVDRNQQNFNSLNGVITPSALTLTTPDIPTDIPSTLETMRSEVTLPLIDIRINATSIPITNQTVIPTKIITTTATIVSSTEPERRSGELLSTPYMTTFRSIQTTRGLTQKPKMSEQELRRQAIKQRFGNSNQNFGNRITRAPPRVSIDNFLSVYKPTLKNQFLTDTFKSRLNTKTENQIKGPIIPKNVTENSVLKPKVLNFIQNNRNLTTNKDKGRKGHLLSSESRNTLSSILLFPSRPKPILKPKLSNFSIECLTTGQPFMNFTSNPTQNTLNTENQRSVTTVDNSKDIERREDNQLIESISKKNLFGYRNKVFDNTNGEENKFNKLTFAPPTVLPTESHPFDSLQLESIMNPQFEMEETPLVLGEEHQYLPMDEFIGAHNHYVNQLKLREQNMKYNKLPNPDLFKDQLNRPQEEAPQFGIRPVDPNMYKNIKKVKATLPNKVMKFEEMMRHLAAVMRSINRLNPIGRSLSDKYKEFTTKLKFDIMANKSKGPYAEYYPPGVYDNVYSPDPVEEKYRRLDEDITDTSSTQINDSYDERPHNYTFEDRMDGITADKNNSYTYDDYDDDGLIKKSFGYRVTVYRSPQKGESNVTEEVLNNDNDLSGNKSDDLTVSESSDEYSVTTDANNNGTEYLITSASNLLRGESQSGVKGNAKGVDYKRNKYNRDKASHAREAINAHKSKKVDSHDRRANNERAMKERTIIEFFEREHILDTAYNKDKLGIDKSKANEDQHTSGSMTNIIKAPEPLHSVPINGSLSPGESHEFANSEQNHVTNGQSFDTIFPEHDRKYKHKDNAHKYKGWKERGYKIITETEFVDRGRKVDTGYKRHTNGSKEHIKSHSAQDVTKADSRKYNKNIKNLNKNFEALYGRRVKSPQTDNQKDTQNKVLMNGDNYGKYYYNNGLNSGESSVAEEHKPYGSTEQTSELPPEEPLEQPLTKGFTSGDTTPGEGTTTEEEEENTQNTTEEKPTEDNGPEKTTTEDNGNDRFSTDNFQAPPIDTDNHWKPIPSLTDHRNNNPDTYQRPKHYNNIRYNNEYNNVFTNDNQNQNNFQKFQNDVNYDIDLHKGFPTITSENYGSGNNPYSMPLVSEEVIQYPNPNSAAIDPSLQTPIRNHEYYIEPIPDIPNSAGNSYRLPNDYSLNNKKNKYNRHSNSTSKLPNDFGFEDFRYHTNFHQNGTYLRPIFDDPFNGQQLTPNYPPMEPTAEAPVATKEPYYDFQVYPSVEEQLDKVPKGQPLFAIIGDDSKMVTKVTSVAEKGRNRKTDPRFANNPKESQKGKTNPYTQIPVMEEDPTYIKPIKINTRIPRPVPKQQSKQKVKNKKKPKNSVLLPTRPLMAPPIDNIFLNSNPIQAILSPISSLPFGFRLPFGYRTTPLPATQMPFDSSFSGTDNRPIAILHPNKMLTITTTNLLKKQFGEQLWNPNKMGNPFRLVFNKQVNDKREKRHQRSTSFRLNLIPQSLRKKRRSFKKMFSLKKWLKSRFRS